MELGAILSPGEVPGVERREASCTFLRVLILRKSDYTELTKLRVRLLRPRIRAAVSGVEVVGYTEPRGTVCHAYYRSTQAGNNEWKGAYYLSTPPSGLLECR
jgi:hypothetical protein